MTEYEEICNGQSLKQLQHTLKYQVEVLGYNLGDSFPSYIVDEITAKMEYKYKIDDAICNTDGNHGVVESRGTSVIDNTIIPSYWVLYSDTVHSDKCARNTWEKSIIGIVTTYDIKFKGIDDNNRPVYKVQDLNVYLGDVDNLFNWGDTKETVDAFYKKDDNIDCLVIFGSTFNQHDPLGTNIKKNVKLNII